MEYLTREQVGTLLRDRAAKVGTQRKLATALGISTAYLSDVIRGTSDPGPRLLRALGLRHVDRYETSP